MRARNALTCVFGCLISIAPVGYAATTVDIPVAQDATLFGGSGASNRSGSGPGLIAGLDASGNPKRGLIEFNIASADIPAGSTITSVTLQMDLGMVSSGASGNETISLFDEPAAWNPSTNGAGVSTFPGSGQGYTPPNANDATWNDEYYQTTSPTLWATAGGDWTASLSDRADATVGTTLQVYSWSSSNLITDVQNWLNSPSSNDGWIIKNSDESTDGDLRDFWSNEGATAYLAANPTNPLNVSAPVLIVSYVPEPAAFSVLALGLLLPLARRRRQRV